MKKILFIAVALLVSMTTFAQYKVIEASSKKAPAWVNSMVPGQLIVTVYGNNMGECQDRALTEISERIIKAVASNVVASTSSNSSEITTNAGTQSYDMFQSTSKIRSANLPFLKGISLSKAVGSYWEKQQDKNTKDVKIAFSVAYPFSDSELNSLIAEYERLDGEKASQVEEIINSIDAIDDVAQIKQGILKLQGLKNFFVDAARISEVDAALKRYQSLYSLLTVAVTQNSDSECTVQLLLNGNPVKVGVAPKVKGSECLSNISSQAQDGAFVVTFDSQDCLEEDENALDIVFNIDGKSIKKKAPLKKNIDGMGAGKFSVIPEGKIYLQAASSTGEAVTDITIRLSLNNRGGTPFGLKSIELIVPELTAPIIFDDTNVVYNTKGVVQVKALAQGTFAARSTTKSALSFVKGSVTVVNPESGAIETLKINLPYSTNWGM